MSQTYVPPSRVNKKSVTIWLDKDQVKDLKIAAIHEEMTIQEFMEHALESSMESVSKRRKAKK